MSDELRHLVKNYIAYFIFYLILHSGQIYFPNFTQWLNNGIRSG